jgi:DNA-binding transcriptional MocR family regulator
MQEDGFSTSWVTSLSRGAGPRYLQVADAIEQAIADGRLQPGDRLPPQRRLADMLGVDLTTVTRGYDEAKRRNLLKARGALGTYVAAPKVDLAQVIDLSMNLPPPPADIDPDDAVRRGMAQVLLHTDANVLMSYHLGGGSVTDRAAGVLWLEPVLGRISTERVMTCPGAQSALAALILALTKPGDVIMSESLVYPGLRAAIDQLGRRLVAIEADEEGLLPDALEKASREYGARVLYLNPTLQNPTASTMSERRRRAVADVAIARGIRIIEDDPYWLLADHAPPPMASFAPAQVYYIATLSKTLTPGLRTAFVVLPDTHAQDSFLSALRSFVLMSSPLATGLATQWIHDGTALQWLAGVKAEARNRQHLAMRILPDASGVIHDGIHRWLTLPDHWTSFDLANAARMEGLAVTSSDVFAMGEQVPNAIRISLGGVRDREHLASALRRLAGLLSRKTLGSRGIVV